MTLSISALVCFCISVYFALICDSLRNFLRSRLALVCRSHNREDRFGTILKEDESALLACSAVQIMALVSAFWLGATARYVGVATLSKTILITDLVGAMLIGWLTLQVLPWSISRVAGEYVVVYSWPLIHVVLVCMIPVLNLMHNLDTLVHRIAGRRDPAPETLETFTEEIQSVVDEGEREGILESHSGKMIHRVMELRQEDVRAVMTPRTDIETIQADQSLEQARQFLAEVGHSRVPVVDGSPDNIVGLLYARDLLEYLTPESESKSLREIVRVPFYVPESTTIHNLLERMKRERLHMAIVLDEYGGVTGLVTLEDILEEIVGDIADEFDEEEDDQVQRIDKHTLWVDARMHLDELNDSYDLELPEDRDFDTIGGLVFSEMGRVPKVGEKFNWDSIQITVLEATERKLMRLELFNSIPWSPNSHSDKDNNSTAGSANSLRLMIDPSEEQAS